MTSSAPTGRTRSPKRLARNLRTASAAAWAVASFAAPMARAQETDEPAPPAAPEMVTTARANTDGRVFAIIPTIGLGTVFTDNVALAAKDRKSDLIARALLKLDARLELGRASGRLGVEALYDQYMQSMRSLSGASLNADGDASLVVAPGVLTLDAHGVVTNGRASSFGSSAIDRSGVDGRLQMAVWDVGPRLTAKLGDVADLAATARFSQISYAAADKSRVNVVLPPNDNIVQAAARLDTGQRSHVYQLITTGLVERDDLGYRSANAIQSVYVSLVPTIRLIARGGYERVELNGAQTIDAPIASAGFEFTPNRNSRISLEGGQRFHRTAWAAHAELTLAERFYLVGAYTESLQPGQVYVTNTFREFVEQTLTLPAPIAPTTFHVQDNVYADASYNKVADLRAELSGPRSSVAVSARYSDREFLKSRAHDRSAFATITVERALRADLKGSVDLSYAQTFKSPLYGASRSYWGAARLEYRANSTTDVTASYALSKNEQLSAGGETINENVVLVAIRKRF